MKRMKKAIALMLVALMLGVLATACGSADTDIKGDSNTTDGTQNAGDKQAAKAKLTVWILKTWSEKANEQLSNRVMEFGKQFNVDAKPEIINSSDISQKFNAAIESGVMPDVTFCMPFYLRTLSSKNLLLDISDAVASIEKENGSFFENNLEFGKVDGKNLALPLYNEPRVLFYRKDILEAAGFKEPPKTWEELRKVAKAVTDPSKGLYGYGEPLALTDDTENNQRTLLWSWGGKEYEEDGKTVAVNSKETISMVQFFVDMYKVDKSIPETAVSWDDSGNNTSYISGQSAMVLNTPTILSALAKPELKNILDNTRIAPIPAGPAASINYGNGVFFCASSKTKYPNEAKEMLKFIMNKDWYSSWIESVAPVQVPTYKDLAAKDFWKQYPQSVCMEVIPGGRYLGYPGQLTTSISEAYTGRLLGNTYQNVLVKGKSVEDAVAEWAANLEKLADK